MDNEPTSDKPPEAELEQLKKEIERLNTENLLLRMRTEFDRSLTVHREMVSGALAQHRKETEAQIDKRLTGLTVVGLIVVGLAWWSTLQPIRNLVTERLDKEFASPNIRELISASAQQAASSQTKTMMENILKPATDQALKTIKQESEKVTQFAQQLQTKTGKDISQIRGELEAERQQEKDSMAILHKEYSTELGSLKSISDYEEKLKDIQLLEGAVVQGDVSALEKLGAYNSPDQTLVDAARAAALEAKAIYITGDRTKASSIVSTLPDGTKLTDGQISTGLLEEAYVLNPKQDWQGRGKAAELLGSRREIGVVEVLLKSMQTDENLWVRREALRAFEAQTGYPERDVFGFEGCSRLVDKKQRSLFENGHKIVNANYTCSMREGGTKRGKTEQKGSAGFTDLFVLNGMA